MLTRSRKKAVDSQTKELEALEAKIKETEERLKDRQSRNGSPAGRGSGRNSPHPRQPLGDAFNGAENDRMQHANSSPLAQQSSRQAQYQVNDKVSPSTKAQWAPSTQESPYRQNPTGYRKPVGQSNAGLGGQYPSR